MRLTLTKGLSAVLLMAGCVSPDSQPDIALPPDGTPVIVLSSGTSEWGYGSTRIYRGDLVVTTQSGGLGRTVNRTANTVPGAYDRVAAVLRRDGPRAVARAGADQGLCPGSVDVISATPPVGRFSALTRYCYGDGAAFDGLWRATTRAVAPPRQ